MSLPGLANPAQQKSNLLTAGRRTAGAIAQLMQNPELTSAERAALRVCRGELERYVTLAETEAMQPFELVSLHNKISDVQDRLFIIAGRVESKRPPG